MSAAPGAAISPTSPISTTRSANCSILERTRMADDTIVVFCSDHGDMLGERGLWFKMCFYEGSARVPLMIAGKGIAPGRHDAPVSNLDVCPTLCDLAGIDMAAIAPWTDGSRCCRSQRRGRAPRPC
jgi:arylsulfatase A-like enzyme